MSYYPSNKDQLNNLSAKQKKILDKIPYLGSIEGWLLLIEAVTLYDIATKIKSNNPVICEIGVWKGKSSYVLTTAIKQKKGTVYSIDPFNGHGDKASTDTYRKNMEKLDISLLKNFKDTMIKFKLQDFVKVIPMTSEKARINFPKQKIDFLFIDGNHDYTSVQKDYKLWAPLVPSGGTIILHDVGATHVDGPKKIFNEQILNNSSWKNAHIIGEMGIATKN